MVKLWCTFYTYLTRTPTHVYTHSLTYTRTYKQTITSGNLQQRNEKKGGNRNRSGVYITKSIHKSDATFAHAEKEVTQRRLAGCLLLARKSCRKERKSRRRRQLLDGVDVALCCLGRISTLQRLRSPDHASRLGRPPRAHREALRARA